MIKFDIKIKKQKIYKGGIEKKQIIKKMIQNKTKKSSN